MTDRTGIEWTDSTWNPTTIGTRTATSTRASNIVLPVATNEFAIGEPVSGFTQAPGAFNIFDTTTPAGAILGKIQTKVSGTGFTLSIVATIVCGSAAAVSSAILRTSVKSLKRRG